MASSEEFMEAKLPSKELLAQMSSDPDRDIPKFEAKVLTEQESKELAAKDKIRSKEPAHKRWRESLGNIDVQRLLMRDSLPLQPDFANQKWMIISYIDSSLFKTISHGDKKYKGRLIKTSGAFQTKQDAFEWSKLLRKQNPHFVIHLVPMWEWTPIDDNWSDSNDTQDKDVTFAVLSNYVTKQDDRKDIMQKRIEDATNVKELVDSEQFPEHKPRPDRTNETTHFFAKVQDEVDNPEKYELDKPKEDALELSLDEVINLAKNEDELEILKKKGCVLKLENDNTEALGEFINNQTYVVLAYIQPEEYGAEDGPVKVKLSNDKIIPFNGLLVRPRGAFKTFDKADEYAQRLVNDEKIMDAYVVPNFNWCLMDETSVDERVYHDKFFSEQIAGFKEQQEDMKQTLRRRIVRAGEMQLPYMDWSQGADKPRFQDLPEGGMERITEAVAGENTKTNIPSLS